MIVNQNIKILIQHLNLNVNQFAKNLGLDRPDVIYNIVQEKTKASTDILELILQKYENVSMNWLLTGKGSMFVGGDVGLRVVKEPAAPYHTPPKNEKSPTGGNNLETELLLQLALLRSEIERKNKEIEQLRQKVHELTVALEKKE